MKIALRTFDNTFVTVWDLDQISQPARRPLTAYKPDAGSGEKFDLIIFDNYDNAITLDQFVDALTHQVTDKVLAYVHEHVLPGPTPGPGPDPTPGPGPGPLPSDTFKLADVQVIGSPDVRSFPVRATFEAIGINDDHISIASSGTGYWPAVSIDGGDPVQSATLWVFVRINGTWYATGAERLRPTQLNGDKPDGPPSTLIGNGWLYDGGRWGGLAGYNPKPGELVGMMLVAGSTRSDDNCPVKERSDIVFFAWPDDRGHGGFASIVARVG